MAQLLRVKTGRLDFELRRGDTFRRELTWKDANGRVVDLSGASARMQIKRSPDDAAAIHAMTAGSGITLGATAPNVVLHIPASVTAGFSFESAVYDLEIHHANGDVETILAGVIHLIPDVTQ